jgi:hypothetical protein
MTSRLNLARKNGGNTTSPLGKPKFYLRSTSIILVVVITVLVAARLALPSVLTWYVNRILNRIPDYKGSVQDIDVALIRGAYTINGLKLLKTNGKISTPFIAFKKADVSIQWIELLKGKLVGELLFNNGQLNFVDGSTKANSQTRISTEWLKVVKDLFPLRINKFEAIDMDIHFRNFYSSPKVDLYLSQMHIVGSNLSNTRTPIKGLEALIDATGFAQGKALIKVKSKLDPSQSEPTFKAELQLTKLPITSLNEYFRAYGGFDAEGGTFELYATADARNKKIEGLVKPLAKDVKIFKLENDSDSSVGFIWEALVASLSEIFENQRHKQLGTVMKYEGKFDNPDTSYFDMAIETIKNAFFKAIKPGIGEKVLHDKKNS